MIKLMPWKNVIKDAFNTLNDKINNEAEGVNLENDPPKEVDEEQPLDESQNNIFSITLKIYYFVTHLMVF